MARFSKVLRKTDIQKRLSVPTGFLSSLPSFNGGAHAVDFQAVDGSGRVWNFRCSIRRNGHPKPVISRGWLAYVNSKSLKVGDKVQFLKEKNDAGAKKHAYEIRAEKEIKIFGAPTDDKGDDAPGRQKKNERRVLQRRKTTTEATAPSPTSEFLTD
ncbi:AP2/ERF and B3 domain-containing protein [Populus alba x Populus x berolinensis]|uniref:AP2/ERF and B3 domain-containing protein n=1 Tax=Populus alba x Populus x berolinensis TaxID=444605 RepID=A0AAD6PVV7_9ROSI|nr:AP2/ERF and B3 domain-containing protein [Populus alba x Populus x berolinensis]